MYIDASKMFTLKVSSEFREVLDLFIEKVGADNLANIIYAINNGFSDDEVNSLISLSGGSNFARFYELSKMKGLM